MRDKFSMEADSEMYMSGRYFRTITIYHNIQKLGVHMEDKKRKTSSPNEYESCNNITVTGY